MATCSPWSICCLFSCCRRYFNEFKVINLTATYGYLYHFLDRTFYLLIYLSVGYLGKGNLAATILSMVLLNIVTLFMEGFLHAQEALAKRTVPSQRRSWLYTALIIVFLHTVLYIILLVAFSFIIYSSIGVRQQISLRAIAMSWILLPTIPLHGAQMVIHRYLFINDLAAPIIFVYILGIIVQAIGRQICIWLLLYLIRYIFI
jgi:hypothetical protein